MNQTLRLRQLVVWLAVAIVAALAAIPGSAAPRVYSAEPAAAPSTSASHDLGAPGDQSALAAQVANQAPSFAWLSALDADADPLPEDPPNVGASSHHAPAYVTTIASATGNCGMKEIKKGCRAGDDDGDDGGDDGSGGHHGGPYINSAAIPAPDPGMSERYVGSGGQYPNPSDDGAFRTVCHYSHMNFDDPIVYPGQPGAAHLHTFFGNTAVNAHTTQESLMATGNSTCRGGIVNRSAYWIPSMIAADGTPIAPELSHFYYKSGWDANGPAVVSAFPEGLRVLAGAAASDSSTPSSRTHFSCHSEPYNTHDGIPTDCIPGGELGVHIAFPMCWVGYDENGDPILDSPDHRSHMAYLRWTQDCPPSHPVRLPEVTFNILYTIPAEGTEGWRLSSDTYDASLPGGYSLHADWFVGWEQDIVDEFVAGCVNAAVDCGSHMLGGGRYLYDTY